MPAIVLPLCAGWVGLQLWLARGAGASATSSRSPGDAEGGARRLAPIAGFVVAGVIWFMVVLGWVGGLL